MKMMIMIGMIGTISIAYAVQVCDYAKNSPSAKDIKPSDERVASPELPDDPCQRCAVKALRGDYGKLPGWKRDAYQWGIDNNITCKGKAKVTSYGPWESIAMWGGGKTASGSSVNTKGCAANPELKFGTLLWTPYGLRYVTDRGGWVKVGYAKVHGRMRRVTNKSESANLDYYTNSELPTLRNAPYAIVKINCNKSGWFTK
jgi:hypothetical protein